MSSNDLPPSSSTELESDCWFGVQNARKRKQIQDRLAQRARRKRLAEAKNQSTPNSIKSRIDNAVQEGALVHLLKQAQRPHSPTSSLLTGSSASAPAIIPTTPSTPSVLTIGSDTYTFPQPALSVYAALFENGRILGLSCSCGTAHKSKPPAPTIPESLHATPTQLSTLHFQWIDRFPFPRMRDNMIALCPAIDEEQFLSDLFHLTSFTLKHGSVSWDPDAWNIGPEFATKWGYLFF